MTLAERTQSGTFVHLRIVGFSNIQTCFGMELVYRLLSQGANEGVTQRKKVGKLVLIQFWNGGAARHTQTGSKPCTNLPVKCQTAGHRVLDQK